MNINGTHYRTIWTNADHPGSVFIIDQRHLPHHFIIEELTSTKMARQAIEEMHVRGAGLIGATAGFGMYLASLEAQEKTFASDLEKAGQYLCSSRPTARNLSWAVERILLAVDTVESINLKKQIIFKTACSIADEDAHFCKSIGQHGKKLIADISRMKNGKPVNILTHCNAGWLAFVDYGSATAPIYAARDDGIDVHVWVDETRPWNQGSRLTAWELQQENIPNTLITDNAGGHLMQKGEVDIVIVGTDRTTHTGDVANKIGTYLKALSAHDNNIPFYVALPSSTFDWQLESGSEIPIEVRSGDELTQIRGMTNGGAIETVWITDKNTRALNYSFDITPSRLVTGLITERGIVEANKKAIHEMFKDKVRGNNHKK